MATQKQIVMVPVEKLHIVTDKAHPLYDERVKLPLDPAFVNNVKVLGIKQPILITAGEKDDGISNVVAGRQRLRAALKIGLKEVPCIFENEKTDTVMYTENAARKDDDPLTKMRNIARFCENHKAEKDFTKQAAIAFATTEQSVMNALRVLSCDQKIIEAVETGAMTTTAALQVYKKAPEEQIKIASEAMKAKAETGKKLTVTKANAKAGGNKGNGRGKNSAKKEGNIRPKDKIVAEIESCIKELNGMDAAEQASPKGIRSLATLDALMWVLNSSVDEDEEKTDALKAKGSKKTVYAVPEWVG